MSQPAIVPVPPAMPANPQRDNRVAVILPSKSPENASLAALPETDTKEPFDEMPFTKRLKLRERVSGRTSMAERRFKKLSLHHAVPNGNRQHPERKGSGAKSDAAESTPASHSKPPSDSWPKENPIETRPGTAAEAPKVTPQEGPQEGPQEMPTAGNGRPGFREKVSAWGRKKAVFVAEGLEDYFGDLRFRTERILLVTVLPTVILLLALLLVFLLVTKQEGKPIELLTADKVERSVAPPRALTAVE